MKNNLRCLESKGIETNCNSSFNHQLQFRQYVHIKRILHNFWRNISHSLFADPNELRVWQKIDHQGNNYWCAYDPKTGKSFASGSETDLYMWIEQLAKYCNYVRTDFSNW